MRTATLSTNIPYRTVAAQVAAFMRLLDRPDRRRRQSKALIAVCSCAIGGGSHSAPHLCRCALYTRAAGLTSVHWQQCARTPIGDKISDATREGVDTWVCSHARRSVHI